MAKTAKKTTTKKKSSTAKKSSPKKASKPAEVKTTAKKEVKESPKKQFHKDPAIWIVAILVLIAIAAAVIASLGATPKTYDGKVTIEEFTDFGCPYCAKGAATLKQLEEEYGDSLEIVHKNFPIVNLHPNAPKAHEAAECAKDQGMYGEYRDWLFANQQKQDINNLRKTASDLGLDLAKFNTCLDSGEKTGIVNADIAEGRSRGVSATPTFFVNGELLRGAQPLSTFRAAIDKALGDNSSVAKTEQEPVEILLLTDSRCSDCDDLTYAKSVLESQMPKATVTIVDYTSKAGKGLYDNYELTYVPAVLFGKEVESYDIYAELAGNLVDVDDYYYLPIQPHDPTAEICDNGVDDTGNGLVDCADESCADTMACREEIDGNVKLFIMSDCPYGRKAIEALKPIKDLFGTQLDYEIHYIASENPDGSIRSLHGQYEVDENVIQLCVEKESPAVHFDYLYCRSTNGVKGVYWKDCAEETGVNINAVEACFNNEGLDLLKEDIKEANDIGVTGSPTWLINNRYQTGGFNSESIKQFICEYNDLEGCNETLGEATSEVTGSC